MKTKSAFLLASLMMFSFTGCSTQSKAPVQNFYSSTDEVTIEKILDNSRPVNMIKYKGGFRQTIDYSGFDEEAYAGINDGEFFYLYKQTGDIIEINQSAVYSDGYSSVQYMSTDKDDPYVYILNSMGGRKSEITESDLDTMLNNSVLGYDSIDAELGGVTEADGYYSVDIRIMENGEEIGTDVLTIDPVSGYVVKVISSDQISGQDVNITSEFTFTDDIEIDLKPKTDYVEEEMVEYGDTDPESAENAE